MAESQNARLELGDLYLIETGNDVADKLDYLKKAQSKDSVSKYEKEQIAWEILSLSRKLNDSKLDAMKTRAEGELKALEGEIELERDPQSRASKETLRAILRRFLSDVTSIRKGMELSRKHGDKAAWYNAFSAMEGLAKDADVPAKSATVDSEAAREALKKEVSKGSEKGSDTSANKPAAQKERSKMESYNVRKMKEFAPRIAEVLKTLNAGDNDTKALAKLLEEAQKDPTSENVSKLQKAMVDGWEEMVVSKKGDPDGKFGPLTMESLEGIEAEVAKEAQESKKEDATKKSETAKKDAVSETDKPSSVQSAFFKDGAFYLTGPKGNVTRVDYSSLAESLKIPKDAPENLKKSFETVRDFSEILDAYAVKYPNKKTEHAAALNALKIAFAKPEIQAGTKPLSVESAFGFLDMGEKVTAKLLETFKNGDSAARRLAVLNFIRDELGGSDLVSKSIIDRHFDLDYEDIIKDNFSGAGLGADALKKVKAAITRAELDAASNWAKNKDAYLAAFKAQNPNAQVNEKMAKDWNEKLTVLAVAKREIAYQKLYNAKNLDGEMKLLQDILGAGTFDLSDRAKFMTGEVAKIIAIEAIAIGAGVLTAGAGAAAINAAAFGRNAYVGVRAAEAYNAASKTKRYSVTAAKILGTGAAFEFGAASTRGLIENGDWSSMHTKEGYVQSIAMMGALSGIGRLVQSGKLGTGIQFKEGAGFAKNVLPFAGQTVIEGTAIFGVSSGIGSVVFDSKDQWTPEQMAQALLMATLFKGAGRLLARKGPDETPVVAPFSEPELRRELNRTVREYQQAKQTGATNDVFVGYEARIKELQEAIVQAGGKIESIRVGTKRPDPTPEALAANSAERAAYATQIRGRRSQIRENRREIEINEELLKNPDLSTAEQITIQKRTAHLKMRNDVLNAEIFNMQAYAPEKLARTQRVAAPEVSEAAVRDPNGSAAERVSDPATIVPGAPIESADAAIAGMARTSRQGGFVDIATIRAGGERARIAAERAASEANSILKVLLDNKAARIAWDITSKEMSSGGIKTALAFPVNIMRLPAINSRKVLEIWLERNKDTKGLQFKRVDAADGSGKEVPVLENAKKSLFTALTSSEKPFEQGKIQSLASLGAVGVVAYVTYMEVRQSNPSTTGEIAWEATWRYLKNMNITLPYEMYELIWKKELNLP